MVIKTSRHTKDTIFLYCVRQGIIFVVDSSDRLRMVVAKDELDMLLQVSTAATAY